MDHGQNAICKKPNNFFYLTDDEDENIVSFLIIYETDDDKIYMLIDDLEDANKWRIENEKKYEYVSKVWYLNKASYNFFWNIPVKS